MVPGIDFDFGGGQVYTVPPLALGDLRRLQKQLAQVNGNALDEASINTILDAVHSALKRNYPELTAEAVEAMVDVSNMFEALACVMDAGGVKRKDIEAKKAAAAQTTTSPTGTPSTPESLPTPAGPGATSTST